MNEPILFDEREWENVCVWVVCVCDNSIVENAIPPYYIIPAHKDT